MTTPQVQVDGCLEQAPTVASPAVTIPPVYIEGDANSVERLVKAHDAAKAVNSCLREQATAAYGALELAGAVGGTLLGAALGPWGAAVGIAAVASISFEEGQKLRALYNCETD